MITRRRILTILAGAVALPATGAASSIPNQWRGIALGAKAQIILDHPDATNLIAAAVDEIRRLESIFSLYQNDSQISRLNRAGILHDPAFELIELLSICQVLNSRTSGAFDPTVQTLWALYAEAFSNGTPPAPEHIKAALEHTGWEHVRYSAKQVYFDRGGIKLTLNGIAQGYIADKIAGMFRHAGVQNVLINTGEIAALGTAPDGGDWPVDLARGDAEPLELRDTAIATSAPLGTTLDSNGSVGHILDPRSGQVASQWAQVSVIDKYAAVADGLSTAYCLMNRVDIERTKGRARVILL